MSWLNNNERKKMLRKATVLLPLIGGGISSTFSPVDTKFFNKLKKPSIQPPNWIFAPVWSTLYMTLGYVLYKLQETKAETKGKTKEETKRAQIQLALQLLLNYSWSPAFFKFENVKLAQKIINIMVTQQIFSLYESFKVDEKLAIVQIPYTMWIAFANQLNREIMKLNK